MKEMKELKEIQHKTKREKPSSPNSFVQLNLHLADENQALKKKNEKLQEKNQLSITAIKEFKEIIKKLVKTFKEGQEMYAGLSRSMVQCHENIKVCEKNRHQYLGDLIKVKSDIKTLNQYLEKLSLPRLQSLPNASAKKKK